MSHIITIRATETHPTPQRESRASHLVCPIRPAATQQTAAPNGTTPITSGMSRRDLNTGTFPRPTTTESDNLHCRDAPTHIFPLAPSQPGHLIIARSDAVDDFLVEFGEASRLAIAARQPMVRTMSSRFWTSPYGSPGPASMVSLASRSVLVRIANSPCGATRRWHKLPKPSMCSRKATEGLGVYASLARHCAAAASG